MNEIAPPPAPTEAIHSFTKPTLAAALTEWWRMVREEPEKYMSNMELLSCETEELGEIGAAYLLKIIKELP